MVAFGHTAVGASVGLLTFQYLSQSNPALGLISAGSLGIISHYITDFIPHGHFIKMTNYKSSIALVIIFDVFLSVVIFLASAYLSGGLNLRFLYILFGIGGAQLPDILDGLIYIGFLPKKGLMKYENNFHMRLHWHGSGNNGLPMGIRDIWQLSAIILSLIWIFTH